MRRSVVCGLVAALVGGAVAVPAAPAGATATAASVVSIDRTSGWEVLDAADGFSVVASGMKAVYVEAFRPGRRYSLTIEPPTGKSIGVGTYALSSYPTATSASVWDDCGIPSGGTLTVTELVRRSDGLITRLVARYTTACGETTQHVELRVGSTVPWAGLSAPATEHATTAGLSETRAVTFTSKGSAPLTLGAASIASGTAPTTFAVESDGCSGVTLTTGQSCSVSVSHAPVVARTTENAHVSVVASVRRGALLAPLTGKAMTQPAAPQGLAAVGGDDGIGLRWSPPVEDPYVLPITGYRVFRDGGAEAVAEVAATSFVDPAPPGTTRSYTVKAVAGPSGEGAATPVAAATVPEAVSDPGTVSVLSAKFNQEDFASRDVTVQAGRAGVVALTAPGLSVRIEPDSGSAWTPGPLPAYVTVNGCRTHVVLDLLEARVHADGTPVALAFSGTPCWTSRFHVRYGATTDALAAEITPDRPTFPETRPGETAPPVVFTVANPGSLPLEVGTVTSPPEHFVRSDDSCSGATVAAGASCTFTVTFAPKAGGWWGGDINVPANNGGWRFGVHATAAGTPTVPLGLGATPMVGRTELTWTRPEVAYPEAVWYQVYRGTTPTALGYIGSASGLRYVDVAGAPGQRYYYAVRASNQRGPGEMTAPVEVVLPERELFYSADTGNGTYHLYARPFPGGAATRPLSGTVAEEDPSVSPDGKTLAYTKLVDNRYHLFVTTFDGKVAAKRGGDVNGVPWTYSDPQWSPDGTRLAVGCGPVSQAWLDVCIATSSGVTRLKNGAGAHNPSWLPNGKELLAVTETSTRRINILAADGSYRYLVPGTDNARRVAVSPDGSRMAWSRYEGPLTGVVSLRVSGLDGGAGKVLVGTGISNDPAWSPDSETVYYTHGTRGADGKVIRDVWSVPSTGGTPVRLTDTPGVDEDDPTVNDPVTPRAVPYVPRRLQDFTGDGRADIAIFRPGTGVWRIRGQAAVAYGRPGDYPVAADYTGDRRADIAVYRPSTQTWYVRGVPGSVRWGAPGDIPVPADYNGDGRADIAVFRPSNGGWYVRGRPVVYVGRAGNVPVPADFTGDRRADPSAYAPSSGYWSVAGLGSRPGYFGEVPVPDDYAGAGRAQFATYSPSRQRWVVFGSGTSAEYVVPKTTWSLAAYGNFDADRAIEPGIFEPTLGAWLLLGVPAVRWGTTGDLPV